MGLGRYLNKQTLILDGIRASGSEESPAFLFEGNRAVTVGQAAHEGATRINDNTIFSLGTDDDIALIHRTTILNTNTALTGVLVGTPVTPAVAANSLLLSNVTANGDIMIATQTGGNSAAWAWIDTSANLLTLYAVGVSAIELGVGLVTVNEGSADIDFRVEAANNANALVIDGGTDSVALGRAVVAGAFLAVDGSSVNRAGVTSVGRQVHLPAATITQTNANPTTLAIGASVFVGIPTFDGANAGQTLTDSATVYIAGEPAAGSGNMTLTRVYSLWVDAGTTALDGRTIVGGNLAAPIHDINVATAVVFNEQSGDIDFRIESNGQANMFVVDAGEDRVFIGAAATYGRLGQLLEVGGVGGTRGGISINSWFATAGDNGPLLDFQTSKNSTIGTHGVVADADLLGVIVFRGSDGVSAFRDAAAIQGLAGVGTQSATSMPGELRFLTTTDTSLSLTERMRIDATGLVTIASGNITLTVAGDLAIPAATAAAYEISDGTTKFYAFDTRVATAGVTSHALDVADYTFASAAGNVVTSLSLAAHTLNYTGATQVTSEVITASIGGRTIAGDTATLTVDKASTLKLVAPVEGTNVAITAASALRIGDAGGTPVNQYGIFIETLTAGATADYAIWVAGANAIHLGTAGTATGVLEWDGATSGTVKMTVAAAAGTWTMTLPPDDGTNGDQLTVAAGDGVCTWAGAASARELKNIKGEHSAQDALDKMLKTKVYDFRYKPGQGTQDAKTDYVGVLADEASWAMHYKGSKVNPINSLGYTVLAFQAMADKIKALESKLASLGI